MKRISTIMAASAVAVAALSSCAGTYQKGDRMPETTSAQIDTVSYAVGMYLGNVVKYSNFGELNLGKIDEAFMDVLNGEKTIMEEDQASMYLQSYLRNRMAYVADRNLEKGQEFLAANKEKEGVIETESGLQYMILEEGTGIAPEKMDTVEVNYEGKLLDGTVFDSSYERGESVKFPLTRVIKGWTEGICYAKEGGKIRLFIPSDLAYGLRGSGPIPANSTLVFDIELIKVMKAAPVEETKAKKK